MFLELKDAAYNTDAIDWIWAEILELGLVGHVALYVMDDEQPAMLAQQTHWQGLLIRGFRVNTHFLYSCTVCDGQDSRAWFSQNYRLNVDLNHIGRS